MKVVLDTNVLVSGLLWKGAVAKVIDAWRKGKFDILLSLATFEEIRRVLEGLAKGRLDSEDVLAAMAAKALWVNPITLPDQVCSDFDDDKFIATAVAGGARYLVTGDKALLAVGRFSGVEIVKPAAFLKLL